MSDRLPDLFIGGAPKSGTSSVFRWLDDHPFALGSDPKETDFFADPDSALFNPAFTAQDGVAGLARAFPRDVPPEVLLFEGSVNTLYSQTALRLLPDLPGAPKCLFILREPARQILSTFTYFQHNWAAIPPEMEFADFLREIREGRFDHDDNPLLLNALDYAAYVRWLLPWRARLGDARMMVCTFDVLRADPKAFMQRLAEWIELDPNFYEGYEFTVENQSYAPRSRRLHKLNVALRDRLPQGRFYDRARAFYRRLNTTPPAAAGQEAELAALRRDFAPLNAELAEAFGLDLSGWQP